MLNYLDLLLLLLLALGAWRGYRLGFVNLVAGWISYLVAGLAAALYARPLAAALDQAWHLTSRWGNGLAPLLPLPRPVLSQPLGTAATRQLEILLNGTPLPGMIKQSLLEGLEKVSGGTVGQVLAGQLVFLGLELITLVVLFYGSLFLLRRLARWGTMGINMAPAGLVNRGLGLALGLLGQVFWLALLVGMLRSLLALPAMTAAPGFVPLARQLYNSGMAFQLGNFYDWLAGLLHTLI
ncbi:Colicin V production protein [Neomoorella glycerini]|uniref:Colicin V production protein n=1 Tax=Neomoorella glycerini TaxID=55779 RepID=A0A6I5ZR90_9FIRM|nr:CvpA family protein [Moorella glycerini]QGP92115.1 Colicin V production protein [Moorella glycerini]